MFDQSEIEMPTTSADKPSAQREIDPSVLSRLARPGESGNAVILGDELGRSGRVNKLPSLEIHDQGKLVVRENSNGKPIEDLMQLLKRRRD